ncbi:hypothetical protein AB0F17_43660 [Nonomuraea sp. NPDC026600]
MGGVEVDGGGHVVDEVADAGELFRCDHDETSCGVRTGGAAIGLARTVLA